MSDELSKIGLMQFQGVKADNAVSGLKGLANGKDSDKIEKAAEQFEGMLLSQMIKSMWATVPNEGLLSGSNEEATYRDFLNDALAESIAKNQSIGISEVIAKDIARQEQQEQIKAKEPKL
jgi:Rod binding domain-containing protein